jgi:hypothetical protein
MQPAIQNCAHEQLEFGMVSCVRLCVTSCTAQLSQARIPVSSTTGGGAPGGGNQGGRALEGGSSAPGGRRRGSAGPTDEGDHPAGDVQCALDLSIASNGGAYLATCQPWMGTLTPSRPADVTWRCAETAVTRTPVKATCCSFTGGAAGAAGRAAAAHGAGAGPEGGHCGVGLSSRPAAAPAGTGPAGCQDRRGGPCALQRVIMNPRWLRSLSRGLPLLRTSC